MIFRVCLAIALLLFAVLLAGGANIETALIRSAVIWLGGVVLIYLALFFVNVVIRQPASAQQNEAAEQSSEQSS